VVDDSILTDNVAIWDGFKWTKVGYGNGYQTVYAHMKTGTMVVGAGQRVVQGQKLGIMGSTGRSTGPHLHFEVISAQGKINPLTVLKVGGWG